MCVVSIELWLTLDKWFIISHLEVSKRQWQQTIYAKRFNQLSRCFIRYLCIPVSWWEYFLFRSSWRVKKLPRQMHLTFSVTHCLCSHTDRGQWTYHVSPCKPQRQLLSLCGHKRQIMLDVRHGSELAFTITSSDSKYESMWNCIHVSSHAKMAAATERAKDITCANQVEYVPTCLCVSKSVCIWLLAQCDYISVCILATTLKWTCPPQKEKIRENLRTKRETGVRGV